MSDKYELVKDDTIEIYGRTLYRIKAVKDFGDIKAGNLGGYVENITNLSQENNCWISGNAKVCGYAQVLGYAKVFGYAKVIDKAVVRDNAVVCDNAVVSDTAQVLGYAIVCDNVKVFGNAVVSGNAKVLGYAKVSKTWQYKIIGQIGSRDATFTITHDGYYSTGCFSGAKKEFLKKLKETHNKETEYYQEYISAIKFAENLFKLRKEAEENE
jgi:carbonic anhydrase/acetyltransferase-like protein (isoleucine patch superfamily)